MKKGTRKLIVLNEEADMEEDEEVEDLMIEEDLDQITQGADQEEDLEAFQDLHLDLDTLKIKSRKFVFLFILHFIKL